MSPDYKKLYKLLGHQFNDVSLLQAALTHRSVRGKNNERLEFLGDAILNFIIAAALFDQSPHAKEGELSRLRAGLVNGETLAEIAQEFTLGEYLRLGPGELKSGGARRKSILADALEAIIGAIYFDSDIHNCRERVLAWFDDRLKTITHSGNKKDAKTQLQEYLQSRKLQLPIYSVLSVEGQAHKQIFHVSCQVEDFTITTEGSGNSRRAAEQIAAQKFLELITNKSSLGI